MPWRARCRETGTAGSASGLEKRTGSNPGTALQADSTTALETDAPEFGDLGATLTGRLTSCLGASMPYDRDETKGSSRSAFATGSLRKAFLSRTAIARPELRTASAWTKMSVHY
jgi:hypothetical protein